jgi:hypothetical protein
MKTLSPPISSAEQLRAAIEMLERDRLAEGKLLHQHFVRTYDSIRPVNLVRSAFAEVSESPELKGHMVSLAVGLVAGHLSKRVYEAIDGDENGSIMGTVIQAGVTNAVARNPEVVMAAGRGLFKWAYAAWKGQVRSTEAAV